MGVVGAGELELFGFPEAAELPAQHGEDVHFCCAEFEQLVHDFHGPAGIPGSRGVGEFEDGIVPGPAAQLPDIFLGDGLPLPNVGDEFLKLMVELEESFPAVPG